MDMPTTQSFDMITKDSNMTYDNYIIPSSTLLQSTQPIYPSSSSSIATTNTTNTTTTTTTLPNDELWSFYAENHNYHQSPNQMINCATSQQTYDYYYGTIKSQPMTDNMCNNHLYSSSTIVDPSMIYDQLSSSSSSSSSSPLLMTNDSSSTSFLDDHNNLLFDHLSKAQLIERVVQLEQEKRKTTDQKIDTTTQSSSSSSSKKKNTIEENLPQEQGVHICRWLNCRTETSTLDELIIHLRDVHIGSGKAAYYCDWIGCTRNRKPFMKRHKMHNHMRTHTGERPFVCTVSGCEKRFSRPDSLNTHIRTHSNIRPYLCPLEGCNKAYFHSRSLRKHVKGHEAAGIIIAKPKRHVPTKKSTNTMNIKNENTITLMNDKNNHHQLKPTPLVLSNNNNSNDLYLHDTHYTPPSPFIDNIDSSSSSSSSSSIMSIHTPTISSFDISQNFITSPLCHPPPYTTEPSSYLSSSPSSSSPIMFYDSLPSSSPISTTTTTTYTYALNNTSQLL